MTTTPYIWGVGSTRFAKQAEKSGQQLAWEAIIEALEDAQIDGTDLDAVYVGTVFGEPGVAQRVLHSLGITDVPILTIENACASGTTAFHEGQMAIRWGRYEQVLALGIEQMTGRFGGAIEPEPADVEGASGMALPSLYAMSASRYLHEGWVTLEQLAQVSVKNHKHAEHNPRAQYSGTYTIEQVLESRMIAEPITLLQCSPLSDAAAAVVMGTERGVGRDVPIRSCHLASGGLWDYRTDHAWGYEIVGAVSSAAYEQAGIGVEDVDLFEVHDAFTIGEIVTTEGLGLAAEGEGSALVSSGHTALGGKQPVNPSGGLLSRGHPLGATGVAQVMEVTQHLRGEAGGRQVEGARVGVVETMGGGTAGIDGNACVVAVLGG